MSQSRCLALLISFVFIACHASGKNGDVVKPERAKKVVKKPSRKSDRKVQQTLKKGRSFVDYAQKEYGKEMALVKRLKGSSESGLLAQEIKKIAIQKHEDYLHSWKHTFNALLTTDFTRNTPLHHYQLAFDRAAMQSRKLLKRLEKMAPLLVEPEDKKLLEHLTDINSSLNKVHDLMRFDLDFIRDKQACNIDINTRYPRSR